MPDSRNIANLLKKLMGVFLILLLLLLFLGFYFLRYLPEKRENFHRGAFQELSQIKDALQQRDQAYRQAIQNFLGQPLHLANNPLVQSFNFKPIGKSAGMPSNSFQLGATRFERRVGTGRWQLVYPLTPVNRNNDSSSALLTLDLDTLVSRLVSTYRDIFDGYLLMKGRSNPAGDLRPDSVSWHSSVIFNSSSLAIDNRVETDSLLQKKDGFSLQGIHDVTIEGSAYKLFISPLEIGDVHIILAGFVSQARYSAGYRKIPFNFIAITGVLILLLLVHLPILKIFLLGAYERVRAIDIRLIIGSYFIAAFIGFFLFTKIFLNLQGVFENRNLLDSLNRKIQSACLDEISSICRQLHATDSVFEQNVVPDTSLMSLMQSRHILMRDTVAEEKLDSLLAPSIYPYPDNIFWIDNSGKWVAHWAFRKRFSKIPLIQVADRQYFRDFLSGRELRLDDSSRSLAFTIQPTLSRLDGEYTITVVVPAISHPDSSMWRKLKESSPPMLLGLGAPMHFVCHTILPPGFNFSIINDRGEVQFDSKPGRALLSNISKEMDDPSSILQSARYRTARFFSSISFRGRQMALLATPMRNLPYTLLVYYRFPDTDGFQEHLIGLAGFVTTCILALLVCLSFISEWSRQGFRLLHIPMQHFDWIYPADNKVHYYRHLVAWMFGLLAVFLLLWFIVENWLSTYEFMLFYITLTFPFHIAFHYYLLRTNNSEPVKKLANPRRIAWPPLAPIILLSTVLLIIVCLGLDHFTPGKLGILVFSQAAFFSATYLSARSFVQKAPSPEVFLGKGDYQYRKLMRNYIGAVLTSVFLISVFPACSVFWLVFKQESNLEKNSSQLYVGRSVDLRRLEINERIPLYKKPFQAGVADLKFRFGIYGNRVDTFYAGSATPMRGREVIAPEYLALHRRFFPQDSTILAWTNPPNQANDGSWFFASGADTGSRVPYLVVRNKGDGVHTTDIKMRTDRSNSMGAARLMMSTIAGIGTFNNLLFLGCLVLSIVLAYRLTLSLCRRIFLIDLYDTEDCRREKDSTVDEYLTAFKGHADMPAGMGKDGSLTVAELGHYESNIPATCLEEKIVEIGRVLQTPYAKIWEDLTPREKFILYDFAVDGFSNYKTSNLLNGLLQRNILQFKDHTLVFMSMSFREFVLQKKEDTDINSFMQRAAKEDSWKNLKTPLLLALAAIGIFIFVTQDEIYQKITGLIASIGTLLPFLAGLFGRNGDNNKTANQDN